MKTKNAVLKIKLNKTFFQLLIENFNFLNKKNSNVYFTYKLKNKSHIWTTKTFYNFFNLFYFFFHLIYFKFKIFYSFSSLFIFFKNTHKNISLHLEFFKNIFIYLNNKDLVASSSIINFYKYFYLNNFFQIIFFHKHFKKLKSINFVKFKFVSSKMEYKNFNIKKINDSRQLKKKKNSFKTSLLTKINLSFFHLNFINIVKIVKSNFQKIKLIRFKSTVTVNFFFFLSKNMFSANTFNNSYFKKAHNYAFQLIPEDATSLNILRIPRSYQHVTKFEFMKFMHKNNFLNFKKQKTFFKHLYACNLFNYGENVHFSNISLLNTNSFLFFHNKNFNFFRAIITIFKNFSDISTKTNINQQCLSFNYIYTNFFNITQMSTTQIIPLFPDSSFFLLKSGQTYKLKNFKQRSYFFESFFNLFFKPLFFKFLLFNNFKNLRASNFNSLYFVFNANLKTFFFYSQTSNFNKTNLIPHSTFFFYLKKKIIKMFSYDKFSVTSTPFYINSLIRFFEHCTGKSVIIKVNTHLNSFLSYQEKAQCSSWASKVKIFRKMLGPRLFLSESLEILYLSMKLRDPFFLSNWLLNMMKKISFWKYRLFFRYLKYVLRYFFTPIFDDIGVRGIKFRLKGKISVAGNARTRTLLQRTGRTGHATFDNKVLVDLNLVKTFTGVMGLKVWIFF